MKKTRISPPSFFRKFLRWYCDPGIHDYIEGDLMETYQRRMKKNGKRNADTRFIIEVLLLFRPGIIRKAGGTQRLNTYGMLKSYFNIGWRNLFRNKGYTAISITGLAIGMMVAILNGLWIWHELSYDKYFDNYERIAKVTETGLNLDEGGTWRSTYMTYPLGTELIEKYSQQFKRITRVQWHSQKIFAVGDVAITANGFYVDENAPETFSFKMIYGSRTGLSQADGLMISQSLATSLFGSTDPMGRTVRINNKREVTVTGVFEDFPQNTEFHGITNFVTWSQFLADNKWVEERALNDWRNHCMMIFAEIPEGKSFEEVDAQVQSALQFDPEDKEQAARSKQHLELYPMSKWHLYPTWLRDNQFGPLLMLKLVGAIGAFVLVLACINFVNLSTARAEKRAKEVGIRKSIGSVRQQLVAQFFCESFLVVLLSFVVAIVLTALVLPGFNVIANKNMTMPWTNSWFWLACSCFIVVTAALAGSYPALYLSSFKPVSALKGTFRLGRLASLPRKVLVVFQFSVSVTLIIATAVIYQQIRYAKNRPVGYDREGLIMLQKQSDDFYGKYDVLRNELKQTGAVYEISESMGPITQIHSGNNGWDWPGRNPDMDESFATLPISHMHGKTVGWQFVLGRDFDIDNVGDSTGLIINEASLRVMKLDNPIGEPVSWTFWRNKKVLNYKIIGVIRDVVMDSPYDPITPTIFYLKGLNGTPDWINIRINPEVSISEALPKIQAVFKKVIPAAPFEYKFADEEYAMKFGNEERIANIALIFASLAILISCLGLLGLASFVAETRTKEIGIRKVLGATIAGLWRMLARDFVLLVLIACVLATPLAFMLMNTWLGNFTYRVDISLWLFVLTAVGAIAITLLTISYQAIKAATMNPVSSLRSE